MVSLLSLFALALVGLVHATLDNVKRQSVYPLSPDQVKAYTPYTYLSSAAYCSPSTILDWTCGRAFTHPTFEARPILA